MTGRKCLGTLGTIFLSAYFTGFFRLVFNLGLQAAGWATAAIAQTWIKETLFTDLEVIHVPTLIVHGIHDKIVPFELAEIQHKMIRTSTLVALEYSGHGCFYDQKDEFNTLLRKFIENQNG